MPEIVFHGARDMLLPSYCFLNCVTTSIPHPVKIFPLLLGCSQSLAVSVPAVICSPRPHLLCFSLHMFPVSTTEINCSPILRLPYRTHIFSYFFVFLLLLLLLLFCSFHTYYTSFSLSSTFSFNSNDYPPSFFFLPFFILFLVLLLFLIHYTDQCSSTLSGIPYHPGGLRLKCIATGEVTPMYCYR